MASLLERHGFDSRERRGHFGSKWEASVTSIRNLLDEESRSANPHPDALEKVRAAADRRRRNQRLRIIIVALGIAAVPFAGLLGVLSQGQGAPSQDTTTQVTTIAWDGVWPHATEEEAQRDEQAIAGGDISLAWQLDALSTVKRFGREYLGWSSSFLLHPALEPEIGGFQEPAVVADPSFSGPVTLGITECDPSERVNVCAGAVVTLERLITRDDRGVWDVVAFTEVSLPTLPVASQEEATEALEEFLDRRIVGNGAEAMLSELGLEAFSRPGGLQLYGDYRSYEVVSVEPLSPREYAFIVHVETSDGRQMIETLFVVARERDGERQLLVDGGYPEDQGP